MATAAAAAMAWGVKWVQKKRWAKEEEEEEAAKIYIHMYTCIKKERWHTQRFSSVNLHSSLRGGLMRCPCHSQKDVHLLLAHSTNTHKFYNRLSVQRMLPLRMVCDQKRNSLYTGNRRREKKIIYYIFSNNSIIYGKFINWAKDPKSTFVQRTTISSSFSSSLFFSILFLKLLTYIKLSFLPRFRIQVDATWRHIFSVVQLGALLCGGTTDLYTFLFGGGGTAIESTRPVLNETNARVSFANFGKLQVWSFLSDLNWTDCSFIKYTGHKRVHINYKIE